MNTIVIDSWAINFPFRYCIYALLIALCVRVISALLRSLQHTSSIRTFILDFWDSFCGFHKDKDSGDRWIPFILGLLELAVYPFLITLGLWSGIGAWIALKTVAQWKQWADHRSTFNRFLIGNILVIVGSFIFLAPLVSVTVAKAEQGAAANP